MGDSPPKYIPGQNEHTNIKIPSISPSFLSVPKRLLKLSFMSLASFHSTSWFEFNKKHDSAWPWDTGKFCMQFEECLNSSMIYLSKMKVWQVRKGKEIPFVNNSYPDTWRKDKERSFTITFAMLSCLADHVLPPLHALYTTNKIWVIIIWMTLGSALAFNSIPSVLLSIRLSIYPSIHPPTSQGYQRQNGWYSQQQLLSNSNSKIWSQKLKRLNRKHHQVR